MRRRTARRAAVFIGLLAVGCGGGGGGGSSGVDRVDVAVLFSAGGNATVLAEAEDVVETLSQSGAFGIVALIDVGVATPTVRGLEAYDAVLVTSFLRFANGATLGDRLAEYVDGGHGVVLAVRSFDNGDSGVKGRFATDDYYAIPQSSGYLTGDGPRLLGTVHVPGHPILGGVLGFDGGGGSTRPGTTAVHSEAERVADWSDGTPLVATRTIGGVRRADLGFYPPSNLACAACWDATTDGDRLLVNALLWVAGEI
jgi:hypothetical protein